MTLQVYKSLVHQYQDRIYSYAFYFLGNKEDAADVTQDVLIRLWKNRGKLDLDRLQGWVLRVTRNACVDVTRKRKTYRRYVTVDSDELVGLADQCVGQDACFEQAAFREQLQILLNRLPEPYRSILILREMQELKYEEISGALNLPLNTVKVYLHRARKMIRKPLSQLLIRETH